MTKKQAALWLLIAGLIAYVALKGNVEQSDAETATEVAVDPRQDEDIHVRLLRPG
jgi:hypothetical protein